MKKVLYSLIAATVLLAGILVYGFVHDYLTYRPTKAIQSSTQTGTTSARIVANGDILLHDILYWSAKQEDGTYDFGPYFEYVQDWVGQADLAIGDFEGTISSEYPLSGYPIFNAPAEIATNLKDLGYDVMDLAHNHILDSGLSGAQNTVSTFENLGISTIGVAKQSRDTDDILIKEVNGIKIAILGYAYGYNGMESNLTAEEYSQYLYDLDETKMQAELVRAEEVADVTIVMPQMGVEYQLEPTEEQVTLYHKMIEWGADVVLGGHPHVAEPSEIVEKDGQRKLIIYSMGNFISNQRLETVDNIWTERGLLMDITFEKNGDMTVISQAKAHPTQVIAWGKGVYGEEGYEYLNYRVMVLEDFIEGGKYRQLIDDDMKTKVDTAYQEMTEFIHLNW
ncbi:CapA family protein [Streptococcus caprae]|uniref:CapA family protein n=1 Tax=Streptococcus caprae TaxID=1640501 RepID=A0ABV8CYC7_9STRE